MYVRDRIKNIFKISREDLDAIIIKNSSYPYIDNNFFYVTGLEKGLFEDSIAIMYPDGEINLIIPELEYESARRSSVNINIYRDKKEFDINLKNFISSFNIIGINYENILFSDFIKINKFCKKSKIIDVSNAFSNARLIKDKYEINMIKEACRISDIVMNIIPDLLNEGIFEYEIAAEINHILQKNGADKPAFDTISSFGKNTAQPHYNHGNKKLKYGDFTLFDFGACFKKYNSDITRTFLFGDTKKEQKEMYNVVYNAQRLGFDMITSGIKAFEVHNAVKGYINKTRFKDRFIHSTGHSLGLSVHDGGARFSSECNVELQENMIFTVEPGVYIPSIGGVRIEDDIIVKKDGFEILTKSPRELIDI